MKESLVAKALRGFFILLPFLIAYLMAGQLVDMLLGLSQPIFDLMPGILIQSEGLRRVVAFVILIAIFIVVAQIAHTALARRFGNWFEQEIMNMFPPYQVLKSLSHRLSGEEEERLQPALMTVGPDARILVAVVEELEDGNVTVFAPLAPAPGLGLLQIVSASKLERLECSMADALSWPMNWGTGTEALFTKKAEPAQAGAAGRDG